jgi:uracil-DNA glycosylase
MSTPLDAFLALLKRAPSGPIFNPWWQKDAENDANPNAPRIRREQLHAFLAERITKARLVLIGEALGYRGGHFTGIPMTSERILLSTLHGQHILASIKPRRTSHPEKLRLGFAEPTATIVWDALLASGRSADSFVLWNTFPWHPYDPKVGLLSNRLPTRAEIAAGATALHTFLELFPAARIVAVGRVAQCALHATESVRHPATAGATLFRQQIAQILRDR